jgi:predicted phosphodiesterase
MRLYAVLSDIHGNFAALQAVERDARMIAAQDGASLSFLCLGDVVDYGPQPNECVAWVRSHADIVVIGNHDLAVLNDRPPIEIDPQLWPILIWTRHALDDASRAAIREWPLARVLPPFTLFHSSLVEANEYIDNTRSAQTNLVRLATDYGLFGHTHIQCYYTQDMPHPALGLPCPPGTDLQAPGVAAVAINQWHGMPGDGLRAIINPGSVGQPRRHALLTMAGVARDNQASYMLLREIAPGRWQARFQRVAYPVERSIALLRGLRWCDDGAGISGDHPFARQLAEVRANMHTLLPQTVEFLIAQLEV